MPFKRKIPLISFLILTIFSSILLGYTLYMILGIRGATKSIEVSIREVNVNDGSSEVTFHILFRNIMNTYLGIKYVKVDIFLNNTKVQTKEMGYQDPIELPVNVDVELIVQAEIDNLINSPNNVWRLELFAYLSTSLSQQASITRSISYGG
jgi:hypothetical protein